MAKKSATKKSKARKPAKRSGAVPTPIKTGRGPTPAQIGRDLVRLFNQGLFSQIEDKYWSPKVVSIEGGPVALAWNGRKAVEQKNQGWYAKHVIHGAAAEGPFIGATGFAVRFRIEVEVKDTGARHTMEEVGAYTVQNGKIVREEFMYAQG